MDTDLESTPKAAAYIEHENDYMADHVHPQCWETDREAKMITEDYGAGALWFVCKYGTEEKMIESAFIYALQP